MPPKAADQKRKRGRPPNASKADDASPESPGVAEAELNELAEDTANAPTPAKRGRPRKNKELEPSPPAEEPKAKRRGRPRREETVEEVIEEEPESAQTKRKSRKAHKEDTIDAEEAAEETETLQPVKRPTRGKTRRNAEHEANEEARDENEASTSNAAKKKQAGPAKAAGEVADQQPEDAAEAGPASKKKRGRPSLNKEPATEEPVVAGEEEAAPKKRGRKPKVKAVEAREPAPEEDSLPAPKKRGRKPNATADKAEKPQAVGESTVAKKHRGRPPVQTQPEAQEPVVEKSTEKRRKRLSQGGEETAGPSPETRRRRPGRPRASDAASSPPAPEDQPSQPRKSKKRPSGDDSATDPAPAKKRRRRASDETQQQQQQQQARDEPATARRPVPKYRHIAPRVRQIPRSTIEEKWSPLAPPSLNIISNLLHLAERPVLQRLAANEKRRDQATSAIRLVTNRLTKKLSRGLPFPPAAAPATGPSSKKHDVDGGRTEELNFERVIEGVAALERQLDPLLHAVELLKAEKKRDERALERDYDTLRTLEANARSEARNFKDSLRKTHVLVPEQRKPAGAIDRDAVEDEQDLKFVPDESVGGTLFEELEDDELRRLAGQVGSHMESMRNNLQQVDGVAPQIVRSRAALQDVLFRHLDQKSYENVLFG